MQISYRLRAGANKSHVVITRLDGVHSHVKIQGEDGVYSRLAQNQEWKWLLYATPRAMDRHTCSVRREHHLRLTYIPIPSKKHFSLDCPSLFITHFCERLSSRSFVTRTSGPTMLYSWPSVVLPSPACSDLTETFSPQRIPFSGLASWIYNFVIAEGPYSDRPSTYFNALLSSSWNSFIYLFI